MSKKVLIPYKDPLIDARSMAGSFNGTPVNIMYMDDYGVQLVWAGSNPVGSIALQVSADYNSHTQAGTWSALEMPIGTAITVSPGGSPGSKYINIPTTSAPWVRLAYTTAGGSSGTLTATHVSKEI